MVFGGFKKSDEHNEQKQSTPPDARDRWITLLDDGSLLVDFGEGQFAHQKFHGYDVVVVDGRRQRRPAGSPEATHRIFVTADGKRRVTELTYLAAHHLTFLEVEQQLYEAEPI